MNKGQSTNDAYPTAAKIALILMHTPLVEAIKKLGDALGAKGREFNHVATRFTVGKLFFGQRRLILDWNGGRGEGNSLSLLLESV